MNNKNKYILGFNYTHAVSYCLVNQDGAIEAALEEERYNRDKGTTRFTFMGIHEYLQKKNINYSQIDSLYMTWAMGGNKGTEIMRIRDERNVAEYGEKGIQLNRLNSRYDRQSGFFAKGLIDFVRFSHFLRSCTENGNVIWLPHHKTHAASAYYTSGYNSSAVLIIDGSGELETVSIWKGGDGRLELLFEENVPHSIGMIWGGFTQYLGLAEGKIMGLSSYGTNRYEELFYEKIVGRDKEGDFRVKLPVMLLSNQGADFVSSILSEVFERPPRKHDQPVEQFHADIAASLQSVTETFFIHYAKKAHTLTGEKNVCMAGGCIQNCVANQRVIEEGIFQNIYIHPAADDAGTAIGAALYGYFDKWGETEKYRPARYELTNVYLGECFDDQEVEDLCGRLQIEYSSLPSASDIADYIAEGKTIGVLRGRAESGPRALGNRSIVASPVLPFMKFQVNAIKRREYWRPFAPSVIESEAGQYFKGCSYSPFMIINYDADLPRDHDRPVVHVDNTSRVQTVNRDQNPFLYEILKEMKKKVGLPMILNTSFNYQGEPIVNHPIEAVRDYLISPLDGVIINNVFVHKKKRLPKNIMKALINEKCVASIYRFVCQHKKIVIVDDSHIHPHLKGRIEGTKTLMKWMGADLVRKRDDRFGCVAFNFFNGSEKNGDSSMLFFDDTLWWLLYPEEVVQLRKILEDDFKKRVKGKTIYIWGNTALGQWIYDTLSRMECENTICFIDSAQGQSSTGECRSPETIADLDNPFFIIASYFHRDVIATQLRQYGFIERKEYQYSLFQDFSVFLDSHEITARTVTSVNKEGSDGDIFGPGMLSI